MLSLMLSKACSPLRVCMYVCYLLMQKHLITCPVFTYNILLNALLSVILAF